MYSKI